MPRGLARYSHRNSAGLSPNPDSRNGSARSDGMAAAATIRQISKELVQNKFSIFVYCSYDNAIVGVTMVARFFR